MWGVNDVSEQLTFNILKNHNFARGDFTYSIQFLHGIAIIYLNSINQLALQWRQDVFSVRNELNL